MRRDAWLTALRWVVTLLGLCCLSLAAFLLSRWSIGLAVTGLLLFVLEWLMKPERSADAQPDR
jgi:hypothetical protein